MKQIVKIKFGSWLYGTNTPASDVDYKGVFIPVKRDIILQRVPKTIVTKTKTDDRVKNTANDIDEENVSLGKYLELLLEGQSMALDMLFSNSSDWVDNKCRMEWYQILANKDKLLHSGVNAYVGYARTQAAKYGVKGSRMGIVKDTIDLLSQFPEHSKLEEHDQVITDFVLENQNKVGLYSKDQLIQFVDCKGPNSILQKHLEVCNRKLSMKLTCKYALETLQRIFDNYGTRAKQAMTNEGVDFKALSHAVRVYTQSKELLTTGNITFPRPDRDLLLKIKKGEMPYKDVATIIEDGLEELVVLQKESKLPPEPDRKFAENFLYDVYELACKDE